MNRRITFCLFLIVAITGSWSGFRALADQVIVMDDFDGYLDMNGDPDDAAFESAWVPTGNTGATYVGVLVPRTLPPNIPPPFDGSGNNGVVPPVLPVVGQAVAFDDLNGINAYAGSSFSISPSAIQAVRLTADVFDFVQGNRRFSVGLRSNNPANLLELGSYNSPTVDPTDPNVTLPSTAYAYRIALWGALGGDLQVEPNWQYFPLPIEFDDPVVDHNGDGRLGNGDGLVTPLDVGPGWHTYSATIREDRVTLTLDLFRDGSIDSTVEWQISPTASPFDNLRMGGPSGSPRNQLAMADNIKLELIDLVTGIDGDFDDNGQYECNDVDMLVSAIVDVKNGGQPNLAFDLTGDTNVNNADLDAWLAEAGSVGGLTASGNPVLPGDATLDGVVDGQDFIEWNISKFQNIAAWCNGDFNADGIVDGQDFIVWNTNKFMTADAVAVPESHGLLTLASVVLAAAGLRGQPRVG